MKVTENTKQTLRNENFMEEIKPFGLGDFKRLIDPLDDKLEVFGVDVSDGDFDVLSPKEFVPHLVDEKLDNHSILAYDYSEDVTTVGDWKKILSSLSAKSPIEHNLPLTFVLEEDFFENDTLLSLDVIGAVVTDSVYLAYTYYHN